MKEINQILDYQPCELTNEEKTKPLMVINDFFDIIELQTARQNLWEMYVGWTNSYFTEEKENSEMLLLYTNLIKLINACYIHSNFTPTKLQ